MKTRKFKAKQIFFTVLFSLVLIISGCSKSEDVEKEIIEEPEIETPEPIDPSKVVTINTGAVVGTFYNFWSTRPMINQTRFNSSGFRTGEVESVKDYVKSYNLVRMLGGRTDDLNEYYQGVDGSGNIITDFSGLITSMRNFMTNRFKTTYCFR